VKLPVEGISRFEHPKEWDGGRLSVTLSMKPGIPVDPIAYAKTIISTMKLLGAVEKSIGEELKGEACAWMLIEAAVIGDKASFTLQGVSKAAIEKLKAKLPKEKE
jgi:hypothetical protein